MAHHSFDPSDIFIKRSHQMPGLRTDPRTYPDTVMKKSLMSKSLQFIIALVPPKAVFRVSTSPL